MTPSVPYVPIQVPETRRDTIHRLLAVFLTMVFFAGGVSAEDRHASNQVALSGSPSPSPFSSIVALEPIVAGTLEKPLYLTSAGDGSGRLFVVEQPGRIRIIKGGSLLDAPFLDITDRVRSTGNEQGLLGLAFHPRFAENGRYIVNYTRKPDGATIVAEYRVSNDPNRSAREENILLQVDQPYSNHNGGMVAFGPDGYLYVGLGDGGAGGDPHDYGQNRQVLLGKILRLDVDRASPYGIPPNNPFVQGEGRPEIFAYGLRNPWRFSFDRKTDILWAADVGQNRWEEVDIIRKGENYGWRIMEGAHCFKPASGCARQGLILPVAEYRNQGSRCSVTGGYVYRGDGIPELTGTYVFGDYCSGELFGIPADARPALDTPLQPDVLLATGLRISSFGEDDRAELYVIAHDEGSVYRLVAP